jgi:hypothetical protein
MNTTILRCATLALQADATLAARTFEVARACLTTDTADALELMRLCLRSDATLAAPALGIADEAFQRAPDQWEQILSVVETAAATEPASALHILQRCIMFLPATRARAVTILEAIITANAALAAESIAVMEAATKEHDDNLKRTAILSAMRTVVDQGSGMAFLYNFTAEGPFLLRNPGFLTGLWHKVLHLGGVLPEEFKDAMSVFLTSLTDEPPVVDPYSVHGADYMAIMNLI